MTNKLLIRKARHDDFDGYFDLETTFNKELNRFRTKDEQFGESLIKNNLKKHFQKLINKKNKLFLVLDDGVQLQGYLYGFITKNKIASLGYLCNDKPFGVLESVFITKRFRKKGYFTALFDEFLAFSESKKVYMVCLDVHAKNPAVEQYMKKDFVTTGLVMKRSLD